MSEVNLHLERDRGIKAQRWLEDDVTKEAFESVRKGIIERWEQSPIEDKEGQHELRLMLKLLVDVYSNVQQVAFTGKMAEQELSLAEKAKQATKRFLNEHGVRV